MKPEEDEPMEEEMGSIEEHPDFEELLETIEWAGNRTKKELIAGLYDESGETYTKKELSVYSRGKLIALIVNQDFED